MKISRLYSNQEGLFPPVDFEEGLNVVLAEIRIPENRLKDTHNLGKTTFGRMLDFGFLAGRDANFFLFKHLTLFEDFVFFFEIQLFDGTFLTVRRGVAEATKISFKKHSEGNQNFSTAAPEQWDHFDIPFSRARELLDSLLDWRDLKPWAYRKGLGYLLRSQDDFRDVFQLRKFANAHADWKPFLAHVLGFNDGPISQHYAKEAELEKKQETTKTILLELGGPLEDASKIDGILLLKQQDVENKQALLDAFDFRSQDKVQTKELVDTVDEKISLLNSRRYSLTHNLKKVASSLKEDKILFNPEDAEKLFREAGVFFDGQIKKDFQQLLDFNKAITEERRIYLREERAEIQSQLKEIDAQLSALGQQRSSILAFLSDTDAFSKYKYLSNEMAAVRADIAVLERQRGFVNRLQALRAEIRQLSEEREHLQALIEADVEAKSGDKKSLFSSVRIYFNEIVEEVLNRKALLTASVNKKGHLEFKAEILDEAGNATSAALGTTYKKLLCIAFDLAILRAHQDVKFPRFVYHDGVFEALDDRKKANLLAVFRRYAGFGIQSIITLIDSDLPPASERDGSVFDDDEVILVLHDEGEQGRLFKMQSW